jgi:hypothetical protein
MLLIFLQNKLQKNTQQNRQKQKPLRHFSEQLLFVFFIFYFWIVSAALI